ncbi:hypothetical protein Zm00014a_039677 [Zea mays]|uniref:Uncharacterized protein n=2 Tax=Zea mays TaxID=4577 RepID=B6TFG7_MAIZE|nr:uncharacterized protein LOC100276620 [Zea mays]ACG35850.1 hypothetical protein [Zea mays]ONM55512.1 hypothetical protein ZEAMMB73_Zm00001d020731 [Zea mays]PWZ12360.1 hypothetical protein Zm00014a_039677 [Zea mays]|eukprot:NP_001143838.1 uncharacterized protein LOC100276620 [Zea mays]
MPCLAQEFHPKLPAANHYCKSLSSLIRETYAHCHVPCVGIAGWSSGGDSDDDSVLDEARDTKQVILSEMRSRQMKRRSRCSVDSPTPLPLPSSSSAFAWSYSYAPLGPRTVLDELSSPKTCVVVEGAAVADDDDGDVYCDADDESEAFFSVKSCFTRSTSPSPSRAATAASSPRMMTGPSPPMLRRSPEAWERFRDCDGWPFGLCRRPAVLPLLPPLPSTPADSWKWRKSVSTVASPRRRSPTPAYRHKAATAATLAVNDRAAASGLRA